MKKYRKGKTFHVGMILGSTFLLLLLLYACPPPSSGSSDSVAPVITLAGFPSVTIFPNTVYNDPGYTAVDDNDGNITSNVVVSGSVDTSTVGTYLLEYNVSDAAGNTAATLSREIIVSYDDTVAPVITLKGAPLMYILQNESFTDPGFTASDNKDGDITTDVVVSGSVDTSVLGTQTLTYNAADAAGNNAESVSRDVVVLDVYVNVPPVADAGDSITCDPGLNIISGISSYDSNSTALTYSWDLTSSPLGASLSCSEESLFVYNLTVMGDYVFTLTVSDGEFSDTATVTYTVENIAPVVSVEIASIVNIDHYPEVMLECNAFDSNGDSLTYTWNIIQKPAGSSPVIADSSLFRTSLTPDLTGNYIIQISVSDGTLTTVLLHTISIYDNNSQGGIDVGIS